VRIGVPEIARLRAAEPRWNCIARDAARVAAEEGYLPAQAWVTRTTGKKEAGISRGRVFCNRGEQVPAYVIREATALASDGNAPRRRARPMRPVHPHEGQQLCREGEGSG